MLRRMMMAFPLETQAFSQRLNELIEDIREENYYDVDESLVPSVAEYEDAVKLLGMIYSYLKKQAIEKQNFYELLNILLSIIKYGEYHYLNNHEEIFRKILCEEELEKILLLALQVFEYYIVTNDTTQEIEDKTVFIECSNQIQQIYEKVIESEHFKTIRHNSERKLPTFSKELNTCVDSHFPIALKEHFDNYVIGQDDAKKSLAIKVYHYILDDSNNAPILMIGDTGTGKNHLINTLSQFPGIKEHVNFQSFDCSKLSPEGFSGDSVSSIQTEIRSRLKRLYRLSPDTRAIVYLDEVSKIVMPHYGGDGENVNAHVQYQLMGLLSNAQECGNGMKILFILGGCFESLNELRDTKNKQQVGFLHSNNYTNAEQKHTTLRDELLTIGFQREFLGRINCIVELNNLGKNDLMAILNLPHVGPIAKMKKEYQLDHIELSIEEEFVEHIAERAIEENLGARSVINLVQETVGAFNFDMLALGYNKLTIHAGILHGEKPKFERCGVFS